MQPREQVDTGVDAGRTDAARKRAEPGRPGRVRVRSLAARAAGGLLVAVAALLALPLQAQAQTISIGAETDGTGDAEGVEGDTIELTVKLSAVSTGAVTAKWRYVLGTARSGDASHDGNQNLMIAAGDTTDTVSVDLVDDDKYEGEESFEIELYDVVGATIARSLAQITIEVDTTNPDLPSFRVDPTTDDVNEGNGTVTVQVVHDAFAAQDVDITITYQTADGTATQPDDYTATTGTLTFPAGSRTTRTVTIPIVNDTDEEEDETFEVEFGAPSVGAFDSGGAKATVTIEDNDTAAQVMGVKVSPRPEKLKLNWMAVDNATGYKVQWKSGGQNYHSSRQLNVTGGSTTSALVPNLTNYTEYTVRIRATRTGFPDGPWSADAMGTPRTAGVTTKVRFGSTSYHAVEGGAERTVAVTMYPAARDDVTIPLTVTNLDTTTNGDYQVHVNGSLVSPGSPVSLTFNARSNTERFTVKALSDSANDHREAVKFGFGTMPVGFVVEGDKDARAPKTATVWLLEQQSEGATCTAIPASVPNLGNLRVASNPRRLNSKGEIKNSGDCIWYKIPNLANNRRHQIEYSDRWVQTSPPGHPYTSALSEIASPMLKVYHPDGTPVLHDGDPVEDKFVGGDRRFNIPLIRFTPATTGAYYLRVSSLGLDVGHFGINYTDIGPATAPATEAEPLTATLTDFPANHDGSTAFTFRIAFSDDVEITPANMRDHALTVNGGTVTDATRVDGRNDLWELTIEPAGTAAVTVLVPLDRACTETGALCTADGVMLSTAAGHSVPGPTATPQGPQTPQPQQTQTPITASFVSVPVEHDGETEFWLELSFDAAVQEGSKTNIQALLGVTGGSETRTRRKDGRLDHWRIRIDPASHEAVTVTLSPSPACEQTGAVCTPDGRTYTNALAARIEGPPGLAIRDAEVEEGPNATLSFQVNLSRPPSSTVTVDYATSNGTALAEADYTATTGTLTFAAGETEKTVTVAVLDDSHDEGTETMTLTLSQASRARITNATATGTITNSDPLPRALMARFGRTAAVHVVDHVEERLAAPREVGLEAQVAGRQLRPGMEREMALDFLSQLGSSAGMHAPGAGSPGARYGSPMGAAVGPIGLAGGLGGPAGGGMGLATNPMNGMAGPDGGLFDHGLSSMGLGGENLLTSSSFALTRETRQGGILSFWSRGARSSFAGREGALSLGGDVRTTMFGADYAKGPLVTGLSLSNSRGLGEYAGVTGGQVASAVTGLYPWLGYKLSDRVSVWGVTGYGKGALSLTPGEAAALTSGLSMAMAAAGTRGALVGGGASGFELAFKADALWVGTSIDGVEGPGGNLAATAATVTRFRTGLEGARGYTFAGRLSLRPSVEVGLRHDGGDAETGAGLDVGGGLVMSDASTGLAVDLRVRMLVMHQADGFRERGMALSLSYNPTPSTPLGFTARVAPSWGGEATSGAEAMWGRETMAGMANGGLASGNRLDGEVGYGLPVGSRFVGTPRAGVSTSEYGRDYRVGYGLGVLNRERLNLDLGVDAHRRESPMLDGTDNGFLGRATLGW